MIDHFTKYAGEYYPYICSHFDYDAVFISGCGFSKRKSKRITVKQSYGFRSHSFM